MSLTYKVVVFPSWKCKYHCTRFYPSCRAFQVLRDWAQKRAPWFWCLRDHHCDYLTWWQDDILVPTCVLEAGSYSACPHPVVVVKITDKRKREKVSVRGAWVYEEQSQLEFDLDEDCLLLHYRWSSPQVQSLNQTVILWLIAVDKNHDWFSLTISSSEWRTRLAIKPWCLFDQGTFKAKRSPATILQGDHWIEDYLEENRW